MERIYSLNGQWDLYYYDAVEGRTCEAKELMNGDIPHIPAEVPGNVDLDLSRAGILPEDLFRGMNICRTEQYETYDWWYCTEFDTPKTLPGDIIRLRFEGVDCLAEYYLNGEPIASTANAFITHEIDVTNALKADSRNLLQVHIRSAVMEQLSTPHQTYLLYSWHIHGAVSLRKPAHCAGWDILPRAVTAGLWKDVSLVVSNGFEFEEVSYVIRGDLRHPIVQVHFGVNAPMPALVSSRLEVRIHGVCEESVFEGKDILKHRKIGRVDCAVPNPKLWWPAGYGEPYIYDTVLELWYEGTLMAAHRMNVGIRTVKLRRTELLSDPNPSFQFVINGVDVFSRGSNWIPMDAFHSRDRERYEKALTMASDIGCNILRIWGGGVYEQDYFYDYCDRHGIMIWQDFMMACQICPMDDTIMKNMEEEFTWVIRKLRTHPSIVLWAGDNEIDVAVASNGVDPAINTITRDLLPRLVSRYDFFRPYLPSSPYITSRGFQNYSQDSKGQDAFVERHLWGARDYYKAEFYSQSKACYVSETGYHGCPSPESVRKIVDDDCVWPYNNEQWTLHSTDQNNSDHRVRLMADQIRQLFAFDPETLEDFSLASQISQAEADKFFIERMRTGRPQKGGIIWWNLIDGWPQMSDAVVDYFYDKKLAYDYIKRSQAPFALMIREMHDWNYTLVAANDTRHPVKGTYRVTDIETGELLAEGAFDADANTATDVTGIRMMYTDQRMLLIEWTVDGKRSYNHYLCGMPAFSFRKYVGWMKKLQEICSEE